jgi:hypothetical protein
MNTDNRGIGEAAWWVFKLKLQLMGMSECAIKLDLYHHPTVGKQGVWGRWNQLQEQALFDVSGKQSIVMRGTCNTSNPIEANMNKKLKNGCGMSLPYMALSTYAQNTMTNLCKNMAPKFGFSVVGDQLGLDRSTHHFKVSGSFGAECTGLAMFYAVYVLLSQ